MVVELTSHCDWASRRPGPGSAGTSCTAASCPTPVPAPGCCRHQVGSGERPAPGVRRRADPGRHGHGDGYVHTVVEPGRSSAPARAGRAPGGGVAAVDSGWPSSSLRGARPFVADHLPAHVDALRRASRSDDHRKASPPSSRSARRASPVSSRRRSADLGPGVGAPAHPPPVHGGAGGVAEAVCASGGATPTSCPARRRPSAPAERRMLLHLDPGSGVDHVSNPVLAWSVNRGPTPPRPRRLAVSQPAAQDLQRIWGWLSPPIVPWRPAASRRAGDHRRARGCVRVLRPGPYSAGAPVAARTRCPGLCSRCRGGLEHEAAEAAGVRLDQRHRRAVGVGGAQVHRPAAGHRRRQRRARSPSTSARRRATSFVGEQRPTSAPSVEHGRTVVRRRPGRLDEQVRPPLSSVIVVSGRSSAMRHRAASGSPGCSADRPRSWSQAVPERLDPVRRGRPRSSARYSPPPRCRRPSPNAPSYKPARPCSAMAARARPARAAHRSPDRSGLVSRRSSARDSRPQRLDGSQQGTGREALGGVGDGRPSTSPRGRRPKPVRAAPAASVDAAGHGELRTSPWKRHDVVVVGPQPVGVVAPLPARPDAFSAAGAGSPGVCTRARGRHRGAAQVRRGDRQTTRCRQPRHRRRAAPPQHRHPRRRRQLGDRADHPVGAYRVASRIRRPYGVPALRRRAARAGGRPRRLDAVEALAAGPRSRSATAGDEGVERARVPTWLSNGPGPWALTSNHADDPATAGDSGPSVTATMAAPASRSAATASSTQVSYRRTSMATTTSVRPARATPRRPARAGCRRGARRRRAAGPSWSANVTATPCSASPPMTRTLRRRSVSSRTAVAYDPGRPGAATPRRWPARRPASGPGVVALSPRGPQAGAAGRGRRPSPARAGRRPGAPGSRRSRACGDPHDGGPLVPDRSASAATVPNGDPPGSPMRPARPAARRGQAGLAPGQRRPAASSERIYSSRPCRNRRSSPATRPALPK